MFGNMNTSIVCLLILCTFLFVVFLVCYFVSMRQKVICQNHRIAALKCRCMLILTDDVAIINDSDSWLTHLVNSWLINGSCLVTINVDFSTIFTHDSKIGHSKVSEWHDIRPSMVTHTRNSCSALTHPKCTHTAVNKHTPWTRTGNSGQPFMLWRPGEVEGSVPCSRAPQSWYWRWRERCTFTPPTYNSCRPETWTRNLSDSLTIRPIRLLSQCTSLFPLSISRKCG